MTNPIKSFLLFCSGASRNILAMKGCEVEHNKYAGIGATILFTSVLASLSGGYAIFVVLHNGLVAAGFGLLWGLIIFNLDRFIVSSIRKKLMPANTPFAVQLRTKGGEFLKALPRLLLAIFISIVITRPLELKLFGVEIEGQMSEVLTGGRAKAESDINQEYADIPIREAEAEQLRGRLSVLETERNNRIHAAAGESGGFGGSKQAGFGPLYRQRQEEVRQAEEDLRLFRQTYQPQIDAKQSEIDQRKAERDRKIAEAKGKVDSSKGLLKQLEALSTLSGKSWSAFWASLFIMLLFISLETAPILVKLFSSRGPYDDYFDTEEHRVYATQQKEISDTNDNINTSVALSRQSNAERLNTEAPLALSVVQALAPQEFQDAQEEIARRAVELWKTHQLNHLNRGSSLTMMSPSLPSPAAQVASSFSTAAPAPVAAASPAPAVVPSPAGVGGPSPAPSLSPNSGGQTVTGSPIPTTPTPPAAAAAAAATAGSAQPTSASVTPPAPASSPLQPAPPLGPPGNMTQASPAPGNNNPAP